MLAPRRDLGWAPTLGRDDENLASAVLEGVVSDLAAIGRERGDECGLSARGELLHVAARERHPVDLVYASSIGIEGEPPSVR